MRGFTVLELMIGLVILAVGMIGFAGMTMMMSQGNRQARSTDESTTLAQSVIEDLAGAAWSSLGADTSLPAPNGLAGALVRTEGPLNRNGDPIGTGTGPYSYYRHVVICPPSPSAGHDQAPGSTPQYCGGSLSGNNRPPELACDNLVPGFASAPGLSSREKLIRVLVGITDKTGKCHFKAVSSLAFNW